MSELKWYDCASYKDLPDRITGIRFKNGAECFDLIPVVMLNDIIAYTLGEPLEDENSVRLSDGDAIAIAERGAVFDVVEPLEGGE